MHFMVPFHVVHDLDGLQINSEVVELVKYQMVSSIRYWAISIGTVVTG